MKSICCSVAVVTPRKVWEGLKLLEYPMMKACAWDKERVNGVESSRMWSRAVQPHVFLVTTSSHLSRFCKPIVILLTVIYCIGLCSYPQPAFSSWCFTVSLSEISGMVQFGIVWGSSAICDRCSLCLSAHFSRTHPTLPV
jgi:hypothetical protein